MSTLICIQLDIAWEDKAANHEKVRRMLDAAEPPRGALVVLPEMFATGFSMSVPAVTETGRRQTLDFLARTAADYGVSIVAGVVTTASGGRGRNEAAVFNDRGDELKRYQKIHPFCIGGEKDCYEAGRSPALFEWAGLKVCPFICYDLRFPEIFRVATRQGAEMFAVIANWPAARVHHWTTLLAARAIENQAFVAGVNRVGTDPKLTYPGRSLVIDPKGQVLADAGEAEGFRRVEIDAQLLHDYRRELPFLGDLREDFLRTSS
jgi:predicted amidohydrolase